MERRAVVNAIIDIDGVLADYRRGLLYWIRQSWPTLAQKANAHVMRNDTWIDDKTMGVPFRTWLELLEMFRMSGGKQAIPLFDGASDMVMEIRKRGMGVVLLTSRPIDLYSNIYRDTIEWLRNNQIQHDLLLWSKSKAEMVHKMRLIDTAAFAIDDEFKHIEEYDRLCIPSFWLDHYCNGEPVRGLSRCTRVTALREVIKRIRKM